MIHSYMFVLGVKSIFSWDGGGDCGLCYAAREINDAKFALVFFMKLLNLIF